MTGGLHKAASLDLWPIHAQYHPLHVTRLDLPATVWLWQIPWLPRRRSRMHCFSCTLFDSVIVPSCYFSLIVKCFA